MTAVAPGVPVVTTSACIAGRELVDDGVNGRLVPADDVPALAQALRQVLDGDLTGMAVKALERAREYTIETMAAAHLRAFETIAASRGSGS